MKILIIRRPEIQNTADCSMTLSHDNRKIVEAWVGGWAGAKYLILGDTIVKHYDGTISVEPKNPPAPVYECVKCGVSAKWSSADCPICFGDLIPLHNSVIE